MILMYAPYEIEIKDFGSYTSDSSDNIVDYDIVYPDGATTEDTSHPSSKYGIHIRRNGEEIGRAMLLGFSGATSPHERGFAIVNNKLLVCCGDCVCAFELPSLNLLWRKNLDMVTCFAIYPFKDDFIIHGELVVTRVDEHGAIQWDFSTRDILVTLDGRDSLRIIADQILLLDWGGYEYTLNEHGQVIR